MCKWGEQTAVRIFVPADLSHSGSAYWKTTGIDSCIAPIVKALSDAGICMRGSCCGHGRSEGSILLDDGRELRIRQVAT